MENKLLSCHVKFFYWFFLLVKFSFFQMFFVLLQIFFFSLNQLVMSVVPIEIPTPLAYLQCTPHQNLLLMPAIQCHHISFSVLNPWKLCTEQLWGQELFPTTNSIHSIIYLFVPSNCCVFNFMLSFFSLLSYHSCPIHWWDSVYASLWQNEF